MTTPIFAATELAANQAQPHVPINATFRRLEAILSARVLDKDTSTPPGSPAEGDRYIVGPNPTGDWAGYTDQIAYYSGGWYFIQPETGWQVAVVDEASIYIYNFGSPSGWSLFASGSGITVAAENVTYTGAGSGSPTSLNVQAALAELYALVPSTPPYDIGLFLPGAPDADDIVVRWVAPRSVTLPINLTGSYAVAANPAAASAVFTIYQNSTSIGTITFGTGSPGDVGVFVFAAPITFAAGDVLAIRSPVTQDSTLADIAITLKGTR